MEKYARNEAELQEMLIGCPPTPFTQLVAHEWPVGKEWPVGYEWMGEYFSHYSHYGVGDLVFKRPGFEDYLVVETKYMTTRTGRTAKTRRTRGRKKVKEQAAFYGRKWKRQHPEAKVSYAWYTNDSGLSKIVQVPSLSREEVFDYLSPQSFHS